mgnify:CR=1 FL=1
MALKTREQYYADLRAMRPNVYKSGKLITDLVSDPLTKTLVENQARAYDYSNDPEFAPIMTTKSYLTGNTIHRWNSLVQSAEDLMANSNLKRFMYRKTGTCTPGACVGWNALNTMWGTTYDMDKELGTNYHERLKKWAIYAEENGLMVAGCLTDAKGDRSLSAGKQPDPDSNVHVKEVRPDGIIVSGVKCMIAGAAACHEIFVLPGSGYKEADADFAVSFVVPRDAEGITIVQCGVNNDGREGWDTMETTMQSSYIFFEDVFVPNDRVFMCREYKYSGVAITRFTANYRAPIGACVAGQGDVMIGAAMLMARANGLSIKPFQDKLVDMALKNELTYGLGLGAMLAGSKHESGIWYADSKLAHANKYYVATVPYETKRICQDIGGGIVETGCLPNYKDCTDPVIGPKIMKALKASVNYSAETRARAARLTEWLTLGPGVPGCMHGGGSPDGARMVVRAFTPFEEFRKYAAAVAGITEDVVDPAPKK